MAEIKEIKKKISSKTKMKIDGFDVIIEQINKNEPWSINFQSGAWVNPNGGNLKKTIIRLNRFLKYHMDDAFKMYYQDNQPLTVITFCDYADNDDYDYSNSYTFMSIDICVLWPKSASIKLKDERLELIGWSLIKWLQDSNLVSVKPRRK